MHAVSIIIPTLNEERSLATLLDAIDRPEAECEVIVMDGGSGTAPPTWKPGFSTYESGFRRETDSPLEQTGFELAVPP